jgi:alanine dehydrogenase
LEIASKGWQRAMQENPDLACGANVVKGPVTHNGVAAARDIEHAQIGTLL